MEQSGKHERKCKQQESNNWHAQSSPTWVGMATGLEEISAIPLAAEADGRMVLLCEAAPCSPTPLLLSMPGWPAAAMPPPFGSQKKGLPAARPAACTRPEPAVAPGLPVPEMLPASRAAAAVPMAGPRPGGPMRDPPGKGMNGPWPRKPHAAADMPNGTCLLGAAAAIAAAAAGGAHTEGAGNAADTAAEPAGKPAASAGLATTAAVAPAVATGPAAGTSGELWAAEAGMTPTTTGKLGVATGRAAAAVGEP